MKVTVLVDNDTLVGMNFQGEPALSFYVEEGGKKILFDTGFSDLFLKNAQILGIDLTDLDAIVFSHGHDDHMGGLYHLMEYYKARQVEKKVDLILHPNALCPKCLNGKNMGNVLSPELLEGYFNIIPVTGSYALTPHLTFLRQIPRVLEFENTHSKVVTKLNGDWEEDKLLDDTSLVFDGEEGLVILSGWAHAGICNTVEAAKAITGKIKIQDWEYQQQAEYPFFISCVPLVRSSFSSTGEIPFQSQQQRSSSPSAAAECVPFP